MHQHALDAVLERDSARVARPAGAAQLEVDVAVDEAAELDITAVFLDGGADARLEQLLDHADDLAVVLVVCQAVLLLGGQAGGRDLLPVGADLPDGRLLAHRHDLLARRDGLGDEAEDLGPDVRPVGVGGLGHGDEVGAVEDGRHAVDVHELRRQRRRVRRRNGRARVQVFEEGRREVLGQHGVVR